MADSISTGDTLDDIVNEVIFNLVGGDIGNVAALTSAIDEETLTIPLDSVANVSRSVIEIDNELMLVSSVDQNTNTATLFTRGRGYRSTVAVEHEAGSIVSIAPPVARASAIREINNEVASLAPVLPAVKVIEVEASGGWAVLPASAESVLDVYLQRSQTWERIAHWEAGTGVPADLAYTGRGVRSPLFNDGDVVQVTIGVQPTEFTETTDTFDLTGLPRSMRTVVVLGAVLRLLPAFDAYRLLLARVGDSAQAQVGPASVLAREVKSRRAELLGAEVKAFKSKYPARVHFTR